jgi:NADH dehydrogenase FAD-containing subunit
MAMNVTDRVPKVVVLGGGFGGLESLFYLRKRLGKRADLTLVSEQDHFQFKPNTIYIPFGKDPERYRIPIAEGLERRHITFVQDRALGVDPKDKVVHTIKGTVAFDELVIATGAGMRPEEVPGLSEHANTIWTSAEMLKLRDSLQKLVGEAHAGKRQNVLFLVPPNNKCSGPLYELVFMIDTWLRREKARQWVLMTYTTYEAGYIQAFGPRLHQVVVSEFLERGIEGHTSAAVARVERGAVQYQDGRRLPFDLLVSFPPYVASTRFDGLPQDERGFLRTDLATRQVEGHSNIYAVGDAGDFPVKQAFLAMLQADAAAEHIAQKALGEEPEGRFDPVSMCIMEQFDKATFAQVPLKLTGNPERPVAVREEMLEEYKVGSGEIWRVGKKMLGTVLPARFRAGLPFHAGATWSTMEAGLKVMAAAFAE